MKIPSFMRQTNNNTVNVVVSISLIMAFIFRLWITTSTYLFGENNINTYAYSEFLINFQGGFVRRGLLGELLYQTYKIIPYPLLPVITIISYAAFFFVLFFFIRQFHRQKYCWWIIFSPLFLGMTDFIVRKDYILYTLLIGCLYLLRNASDSVCKRFFACVIIVLGLFFHEAFIFFGFPIYALILLSFKNKRLLNYILILIPILIFLILCKFKGSSFYAVDIVNSWNKILPETPLVYNHDNSIGAIGWETIPTFIYHLRHNADLINGGIGIVMLPVCIMAAYYLFSNFLSVFNNDNIPDTTHIRQAISLLYSLAIICLLPMFTFLSCDVARIFQYSVITTFATLLILSPEIVITLFPNRCITAISFVDKKIHNFLPPTKGLLILILLFLGMPPYYFTLATCWLNSVIGSLLKISIYIFSWLVHLFL